MVDKKYALVLSGGSTKVPLHVGAIRAIEENYKLIDSVYCNSAGAIIGTAVALGMNYIDLTKLVYRTNFDKLVYQSWWDKIRNAVTSNALVPGDRLYKFLKSIYGDKTFKDTSLDLYIIGHNLGKQTWDLFSKDTTPDMELAKAVRISTSVPLLFKPEQYNNAWYVDGGLSKDFPVDLVPEGKPYIGHLIIAPPDKAWESNSMLKFGLSLIDQLINGAREESIRDAHKDGIIVRSNYEKSITDFTVSVQEKHKMLKIGYTNMNSALKARNK